jgi:hypothetical protein
MAEPSVARRRAASGRPGRWWWGFVPFAVVAAVHVAALAIDAAEIAAPTKLILMPLLVLAALWGGRGTGWGSSYTVLFLALAFSWLGDGAATFFPSAPELPTMLLCFGAAHVCYILLFVRRIAVRPLPRWAAVYAVWWVVLLAALLPTLLASQNGGLWAIALGLYGLVLGGTATAATRCRPMIAVGAAFFLASDSILAFRLFLPDAMPAWTSPLVMLTYCLGQGLIVAGVVASTHSRSAGA